MSKRAHSLSTDTLLEPARSSRRRHLQPAVSALQLLPVELLAVICSFLPLSDVLLAVGATCHAITDRLTPSCLANAPLVISSTGSAVSLLGVSDRSRALLAGVAVLSLRTAAVQEDAGSSFLTSLCLLQSPRRVDASVGLWLFPSLRSLYVGTRKLYDVKAQRQVNFSPLLSLLRSSPASFSSLSRLNLQENRCSRGIEVDLSSLSSLQALTHLRLLQFEGSAAWFSSLIAILHSLPLLQSVDVSGCTVFVHTEERMLCSLWPSWLRVLWLPDIFEAASDSQVARATMARMLDNVLVQQVAAASAAAASGASSAPPQQQQLQFFRLTNPHHTIAIYHSGSAGPLLLLEHRDSGPQPQLHGGSGVLCLLRCLLLTVRCPRHVLVFASSSSRQSAAAECLLSR